MLELISYPWLILVIRVSISHLICNFRPPEKRTNVLLTFHLYITKIQGLNKPAAQAAGADPSQ